MLLLLQRQEGERSTEPGEDEVGGDERDEEHGNGGDGGGNGHACGGTRCGGLGGCSGRPEGKGAPEFFEWLTRFVRMAQSRDTSFFEWLKE